jgi:hypothetical protein
VIGDAPRDIEAGHAAGLKTILFTHPGLKTSSAALAEQNVKPDFVCASLSDAMDYIENNGELPEAPKEPESMKQSEPVAATSPPPPAPATAPAPDAAKPQAADDPPATSVAKLLAHAQPHSTARLESLANEILHEIRRQREQPQSDFSVSKLMAGVVQVLVLFVLFMSFLNRNTSSVFPLLLLALTLQTMTIALLIMGRQK